MFLTKIFIYSIEILSIKEYKSISSYETWPELKINTFFGVLARSLLHDGHGYVINRSVLWLPESRHSFHDDGLLRTANSGHSFKPI